MTDSKMHLNAKQAKEKVTEPQGIKSISSMMPIFC